MKYVRGHTFLGETYITVTPDPQTKRIRSDTSEEATTNRIVNNSGVKGFNLLVQLSNHIPKSFKGLKVRCSQHILTTGCKRIFEDEEVQQLLADVDSIPESNSEIFGKPPDTILWEATMHMDFQCSLFSVLQ